MKKRKLNNNFKNVIDILKKNILLAIFIAVTCFMTVGYAAYQQILSFSGSLTFKKHNIIEITDVTLLSSSNVDSSLSPEYNKTSVDFDVDFYGNDTIYEIVYSVELKNETANDYVYSEVDFQSVVSTTNGTGTATLTEMVTGIDNGDVILAGTTKVITITLSISTNDQTSTYNVISTANIILNKNVTGSLLASVSPNSGNLQLPSTQTSFTVSIINTYNISRKFTLSLANTNFYIAGNSTFTIAANTTKDYTIIVKPNSEAIFLTNSESSSLILSANGLSNINVGSLTFAVDIYVEPDTSIPEIGPVTLVINNTSGQFQVNWSRLDTGGSSITNYAVLLYNSSDALISTKNTNSDVTTYTFTGIAAGTYYAKVYGEDEAGNTGASYVSTATTSSIYCRRSTSYAMQWTFTVTNVLSNLKSNGATTAALGSTYTATLSASSVLYSLPSTITVKMGGVTLVSGTGYTYSSSTGAVSIPNVNGNIEITATGTSSCLVEGTKIMLANKTTKNIEDIKYDDLLLVWNYETGSFSYQYPIWLEKESISKTYQLITFSDGSVLKVVGKHGLFDLSSNLFVSTDDKENFKVGSKIAKINSKNNGFDEVIIKKIETKYEKVKYYHVVSTRYYNVIANNMLTTDGTVILSNLYGFNKNITWPSSRNDIINNKENLYTYSDFKDIVPYYMFVGMRMEEAKYLSVYGLSKDIFTYYLLKNQVNEDLWLKPMTNAKSQYLWMVTTSDDNIINKKDYLVTESSLYMLKKPKLNKYKIFIGWYNTVDGKYYQPNDLVSIYSPTHFIAVWK
ncbi:MAG: hypothetical protein GX758_02355 [Tenericutes bacterium]|nr:hypothetical protein [Mycoplasmatota bacterium]